MCTHQDLRSSLSCCLGHLNSPSFPGPSSFRKLQIPCGGQCISQPHNRCSGDPGGMRGGWKYPWGAWARGRLSLGAAPRRLKEVSRMKALIRGSGSFLGLSPSERWNFFPLLSHQWRERRGKMECTPCPHQLALSHCRKTSCVPWALDLATALVRPLLPPLSLISPKYWHTE